MDIDKMKREIRLERKRKDTKFSLYFWGIMLLIGLNSSEKWGLIILVDILVGIFILWKLTPWMKALKENEKALALADKIVKDMSVLHDPEFRKEFEELDWEHQALVIREAKRKLKIDC